MNDKTTDYIAYGLRIRSPIALPLTPLPHPSEENPAQARAGEPDPDVTVRIGATPARLPKPVGKRWHWETAPGVCLVTWEGIARYLTTNGSDILVEPLGACERDMGAFLIGQPLAALLQQRGLTTLHASAVGVEGGAVLFAGFKGAGKSTLAAALSERGVPMLSDDLTGVALGADGRFMALPGVPFSRIATDSLEALGRQPRALRKTHANSHKHLLPAARLCAEPLPVRAVYVLRVHGGAAAEVKQLPLPQAVNAFLMHTLRKRFLHGLGVESEHFRTVERMAAQVPVFHLNRPARPLLIKSLAESVMAHLQSSAGVRPASLPPQPQSALAGEGGTPASALNPQQAPVARRRGVLHATQGAGGLFDQAEGVLQSRLAARPNDPGALLRLGDIHRGKGNLQAALDAFRRVLAVCPEHPKASWLHAILGGADLPDPPASRSASHSASQDVWPVPFVRVENFLSRDQHDAILNLVLTGSRRGFSEQAAVGGGYMVTEVRQSLIDDEETFKQAWLRLEPSLREFLAERLPRLGRATFGDYRLAPLSANAYLGGGFYAPHCDDSLQLHEHREFNCVYYLHRRPKPFSGGDLLLHDGPKADTFTRLEPLDNSLVVFPAISWHEVTVVEGDPDDFGKGRFSVNAALMRRTGVSPP